MTAKQQLEKYLDMELPAEILLFHAAMALSLLECFMLMLFTLLLRINVRVPLLLFVGIILTLAAMYAESRSDQLKWISAGYLILMHFILVPLVSYYVPYAIYDFPVYFLTGIAFTSILLKKRWAAVFIVVDTIIDIVCIRYMLEQSAVPAATLEGKTQYNLILFCRIIVALFITGTVCGILISYRNRILRREIDKSTAMEQEAEQLSYAKNMFLVNVSHEIRTPLNAILGITELLLDLDTDDRIKENAFHIANSSKALLSITNELMDFSRLDDSDLVATDKPYYIANICNELINVLSVRYADYKTALFVDIQPDIPAQLCGDETMVRQIMLDVLNGIMKSLENGEVYLNIRKEENGENQINLCVEAYAEGIFQYSYKERLYRSDVWEAECDELIPLPQRLVQLMGGALWMEEEPVKRRYSFEIPQKYIPGKSVVDKFNDGEIRVLFYEKTNPDGSVFAKTLHDMNVDFCQASTDEVFFEECVDKSYTHLMIASEHYNSMKDRLSGLLNPQSVILIGSDLLAYDDALVKTTFERPVNCLNLDALFRDRQSSTIRRIGYKGGFVCPDARIMVVDDNIVNLEVATSLLSRYHAQVLVAASGKECLKMLQRESVDFIFLDYMMPEMDGIDTLKNIRALGIHGLNKVPVAALTANAVSGAREMFLDAGFDEYLSKPIERDKFEKILREYLPKDKIIYTANEGEKAENYEM